MRLPLRTVAHLGLALLPTRLKVPLYRRLFGFQIADDAEIGCSLLDVDHLELGPGARIGHGNILSGVGAVKLDRRAEIGFGNVVRGGSAVHLGPYSTVLRFNVLNSIPDNDATNETDARLILGEGAYVVSGHRLDFTDRIRLGRNVIVAGRNSSFWTHNRQVTSPIEISDFCYLGSEVRLAPGASLGTNAILAMGAVLAGAAEGGAVHGGVPARRLRPITAEEITTLRRRSRKDMPEDLFDP